MEDISIFAAFGAGLASFITPCVLPMVPVYIASLAGPEILETRTAVKRMPVFLHSLSFVLGFTLVFTLMGALVGLAGININPNSLLVQVLSYVPFTSPVMMLQRLGMTEVPPYQIAISLILLILGIGGTLWAGAKVFRMGLLMYGKRPSVSEILRALRQA